MTASIFEQYESIKTNNWKKKKNLEINLILDGLFFVFFFLLRKLCLLLLFVCGGVGGENDLKKNFVSNLLKIC